MLLQCGIVCCAAPFHVSVNASNEFFYIVMYWEELTEAQQKYTRKWKNTTRVGWRKKTQQQYNNCFRVGKKRGIVFASIFCFSVCNALFTIYIRMNSEDSMAQNRDKLGREWTREKTAAPTPKTMTTDKWHEETASNRIESIWSCFISIEDSQLNWIVLRITA